MSMSAKGYAWFAALSILAALVLRSPALEVGLIADDWDHYAMSAGIYPVPRSAFEHFDFVRNTTSDHAALQASGRLPWWISPDLHMALFRPLSSVLGHMDYAWFDALHHPARMHAHSLVWWLILVTGVACVLTLVLPLPAAALGTLLYALEDAHILPATWVANRSELIANAFIVWALFLRLLGARRGDPRGLQFAAYLLVTLGLLAGEHALPALAYLAAFELCRSELRLPMRLRGLIPLAALVAGVLIVRRAGGYGAAGLQMYVEPLEQPIRYLKACGQRLPLLFGDVVFGISADWFPAGPTPGSWLAALPVPAGPNWAVFQQAMGWLAMAGVGGAVLRLRRCTEPALRGLYWLLLAAAASLPLMCASVAMGRLTVAAALGVDAAWAYLATALARKALAQPNLARCATAIMVGASVVYAHVVGAGMRAWGEARGLAWLSRTEAAWVRLDNLPVSGREVMLLTTGCAAQWVIPFVRHGSGLPLPVSSTPLSAAFFSWHELIRPASNVLELRFPIRPFVATFTDSVYRSAEHPFRTGDHIQTPNFAVDILAAEAGEPTWLRFQFPRSLDDPRYLFLHARAEGYAPFALPAVGERITLAPGAWPQP